MKDDKSNFAVCCWSGMDDYELIKKNAIAFKAKAKSIKDKHAKDYAYKLKQQRKKYSKLQAAEVKASFRRFQVLRENQFKSDLLS